MHKIAFNPLPWFLYPDGWHPERAPALGCILDAIKAAGYSYVHAEIPNGKSPRQYLDLLSEKGLAPAPGYFSASCSNSSLFAANIEAARRTAAAHAELGLDRIFLAEKFGDAPARFKRPAQGVDANPARLGTIIDGIGQISEAMTREGVKPCLHQHVGTWIETVEETAAVLDAIPANMLLLGADTGHLTWVGANAAAFVERYCDRLGALHIKDMRSSIAIAAAIEGLDYHAAGGRHIWTEPGRGDVDFEALFGVLASFDDWFVVEVDIKDQPTVEESARMSFDWLSDELGRRS